MAGYLLYFPGQNQRDLSTFKKNGIADLARDASPEFADFMDGPNGGGGIVAFWRDFDRPREWPTVAYKPDSQIWKPCHVSGDRNPGAFWMGWDKASPPTPESLIRNSPRNRGCDIKLNDGNIWHVPSAKDLPKVFGKNESGQWIGKVKDDNVGFFERSERALREWCIPEDGREASFKYSEAISLCAEALGLNYRINEDLIAAMELLDQNNIEACLDAITCAKRIMEELIEMMSKKKEELLKLQFAGVSSSDGEQD